MIEVFKDIKKEVKQAAETAWFIALKQNNPATAATFLNTVTNYYNKILSKEEREYLQFYFNLKMMEEQNK